MMEFFPPRTLAHDLDQHSFRASWYDSHLRAMEEQPLVLRTADQPDVFRFLYLPTFDHPLVVHLTAMGEAWKVIVKRSDGFGGYSPGKLTSRTERDLPPKKVVIFNRLLQEAGFWEMPSFIESFGLDGSQVVLEGVRSGQYHVVDRWSPHGTPYAKLVDFFLKQCKV
jgi:hypothetical protein